MFYCYGLGYEMVVEKILWNIVGMVWEKGYKLVCVSLYYVYRKYGYGIWGNWYFLERL